MRKASRQYDADFLASCTLYASAEPCSMCSSAIVWGNVRRVIFGLSGTDFHKKMGVEVTLCLSCRDLFATAGRRVEVVGPLLADEAIEVHREARD
jgi:tRNA(Arg) A34 adenosine deaminase TadA